MCENPHRHTPGPAYIPELTALAAHQRTHSQSGRARKAPGRTGTLLINHDPPEHTRLRKLVSRLLTPRSIAALEEKLATVAGDIVTAAAEKRSGNFVDDIAMKLPLLAIADQLSVPEDDREKLFHWSNLIMNTDDPDFDCDPTMANAELMGYAYTMAEQRRHCPADDIITRLVQADMDGEALGETEIDGIAIGKGQRVGLFYSSANYDEEVFDRPFAFDIRRNPNPHLAFGGQGTHYCIGANLARMEIRLIFDEIARQLPDITTLAEPQRLRSGWINGVKELQVSYHG